ASELLVYVRRLGRVCNLDDSPPVCCGTAGLNGPVLAVNPEIDIAPYLQIEEQLRGLIQRGDLSPGTLLPTVRQLASDLNVAPNTVARAYADLQDGGWLVSEGRRGTHVAPRLPEVDGAARVGALRTS